MAIAFYCVSNLAIINAVNVKLIYFPEEEADLYIRFVNGTDKNLVHFLMDKNIFSNVFCIDIPDISYDGYDGIIGLISKIKRLRILLTGKLCMKYISNYLDILPSPKIYEILIVMHLDAHAVYYANYFKNNNKRLKIQFIEEGSASYLREKKHMTSSIRAEMSYLRYFGRLLGELPYFFNIKRCITSTLYVYYPEAYDCSLGFCPQKIYMHPITKEFVHELYELMDPVLSIPYRNRPIYYIANPKSFVEPTYDMAYRIIDTIRNVVKTRQIAIKTHSNASTDNKLHFGDPYKKKDGAFIDQEVYIFEFLLAGLGELVSKKIIVSRGSSVAMYAKLMSEQEPYIILTFRLFTWYGRHGDKRGDQYAAMLKKIYQDSSRIMIPNTLGDLEDMVEKCINKIYECKT